MNIINYSTNLQNILDYIKKYNNSKFVNYENFIKRNESVSR